MEQTARNILVKTAVVFCAIFFLAHPSLASEDFYTIQAGVYSPAALEYAKKHLDRLSKTLKEGERDSLRIEQGKRFFIVRVGKFHDMEDASRLLEKIKALVPDAFILKETEPESSHIAKPLADKPLPPGDGKSLPLSTPSREKQSPVKEEYYTLQIKRFSRLEDATKDFDILKGRLPESDLDNLRIEKAGSSFYLRIGRFSTYGSAKEFLTRAGSEMPAAVIIKEKSEDEQIVAMYGKSASDLIIIERKGEAGSKTAEVKKSRAPDAQGNKNKELDLFFKDLSAVYYDAQYGRAAELIRKGLEKWPDNPDLYAWYGATLLNMKYPENALEQYKKASKLSPDVPDYHAGVGLSLLNIYMDRAKDSIDAFTKALDIDPQNVSALEGLGFVYASIGKKDLAMELYTRLYSIDKAAAQRLYQAITQGVDWGAK